MRHISGPIDLGAAFDASPNRYMLLTPDLRYAGMNQAYLDATERTREQLIGQPIFEAFTGGVDQDAPENVRQLMRSLEKVLRTGERDHLALIRYPIPVDGPDGETVFEDRYWSATHSPIHDSDGKVAYILQHTTDVTELELLRRRAESEDAGLVTGMPVTALDAIVGGDLIKRARLVQADNDRLATERNRLIEMFMQAPGFVAVLTGPDHRYQLFNEAYRRLTAYRELEGLTVAEALPEVRAQGFIDMLDSVFQTGEPVQGHNTPLQIARSLGGPLDQTYVDFIYQPIRDDQDGW